MSERPHPDTRPAVLAAVKETAVPASRHDGRKSILHTLTEGCPSMIRSAGRRIVAGDGDLAELAALFDLIAVINETVDVVAAHLLANDNSRREVGAALGGMSPQAVGKRYPGASSRPPGGQRGETRIPTPWTPR